MDKVIEFYNNQFNINERKHFLDTQCQDIIERQDRALKARKQLAEDTKESKKLANTLTDGHQVTDVFSKLLKIYQQEIDLLTKRAKTAEGVLQDLNHSFYEAPDIVPFLSQIPQLEQALSKSKFENVKLQTELKEFELEFSKLKNQDITIRELEDRVAELEDELQNKDQQQALASELVKEKLVEDLDLKKEIEELKTLSERNEREANEQRRLADLARSELYDLKSQFEERDLARQTEIDLLQDELNNVKQQSQSENEVLRLRKLGIEEEERERKRREEELSRLYAALDAARIETTKARDSEMECQLRREREVEEMRLRGEERYQKERERVLELERKLVELSSPENKEEAVTTEDEQKNREKSALSSMESLIAQMRLALTEKEKLVDKLSKDALIYEERLGDQNELIRKLQQIELSSSGTVVGNSMTSMMVLSSPTGEGSASNESVGGGMVSILQDQRDRFRRRMLELEQELEAMSGKEKRSRELLERTRVENAALAERVRGLRAQKTNPVGGGEFMLGPGTTQSGPPGRDPLHITLRFIAAHSFARSALLFYIAALHLLVLMSVSSYSRDEGVKSATLRAVKMD